MREPPDFPFPRNGKFDTAQCMKFGKSLPFIAVLLALNTLGSLALGSDEVTETPPPIPYISASQAQALSIGDVLAQDQSILADVIDNASRYAEPLNTSDGGLKSKLDFCRTGKWAPTCLTALMIYRCNQYAFPLSATRCEVTAAEFVRFLDIKKIDVTINTTEGPESYNLPVIFTTELNQLIQDSQVQDFLTTLMPVIRDHEKSQSPFNLWNYTLKKANNDQLKALQWLGVLFQDTSFIQVAVAYLNISFKEKRIPENTFKAIQALKYLSEYLDYPNMIVVNQSKWFSLYPEVAHLDCDLNYYKIYHFYPIAYAAKKLNNDPLSSARLNYFMPFLFNADYKFQTMDAENWPFKHPRPFVIKPEDMSGLSDIYQGLAGGLWAVGFEDKIPEMMPFLEEFAAGPYGTMRDWFWKLYFRSP